MKTQLRNDKRGRIVSVGRIRIGITEEIIHELKLEELVGFCRVGILRIRYPRKKEKAFNTM